MALSRWAERLGVDRSDVRFFMGAAMLGGGLGCALAPSWGCVAVGVLVVSSNLVEWVAVLRSRQEGGEG